MSYSRAVSLACRLTSLAAGLDVMRPPHDDLRVPTTELEDTGGGRGVQYRVAGGGSRAAAGRCQGARAAGRVPPRVVPVLHRAGGCVVRAGGRGAVRRWAGEDPGGAVAGGRAPAWARGAV